MVENNGASGEGRDTAFFLCELVLGGTDPAIRSETPRGFEIVLIKSDTYETIYPLPG